MRKSVPLSVRISDDDAAYLAQFEAPGATTPSEKLRAILAAARERDEGAQDFAGCANVVAEMLRPAMGHVRRAQREAGLRSELVLRVYERMPELMAELLSAAPETENGRRALEDLERRIADQIFAMMEEILDMGLTSQSRCYSPNLIGERLTPILEILALINLREQRKGEPE